MAHAVTTAGSFTCTHKGSPEFTSTAKLTVTTTDGTETVMLFSAVASLGTYKGCTFKDQNGNTQECATTTVTSGGKAGKLTAGGEAVLLDSIQATAGTPAPPLPVTVAAGQARLTVV
jgi:hypothetical protein